MGIDPGRQQPANPLAPSTRRAAKRSSASPSSRPSSPRPANTSSRCRTSTRRPTRSSRRPTRKSSPPTRSCRASTKSSRPRRRSWSQRAQEAQASLAAIVSCSDDAIVSTDLRGVVQTWNRGAQQLFGYTAEEAIGQPTTLLIPLDRIDEYPGILERVRRGETIDHYETVRQHKDGKRLDISLTISPIRDAGARIIGGAKIARDITERKRIERELAYYIAELSAADLRKNEFLAMLGHELRNPLSAL
ncbi:MAG TPA: PAS domain S-box protein, partial [Kofleriaceae bacterium]